MDTIVSFGILRKGCYKFSQELSVDLSGNRAIKMMKLNGFPPDIEFSLLITDNLHIHSYGHHMKVQAYDLFNLANW